MLEIKDFKVNHVEEAQRLALMNYERERAVVTALPCFDVISELTWYAENTNGIAAFENGKMVGYFLAWGPYDNAYGCNPSIKGIWSPAHCNCAIGDDKTRIYKEMYQFMADKWVKDGGLIHAISLYAHDEVAINAFFTMGFGLRCIDAIKAIEQRKIEYPEGISFKELPQNETGEILNLNNALINHLGKSPCFLNFNYNSTENIINEAIENNIRYFIAKKQDEIIGYIKICDDGEHIVSKYNGVMNICGAYLLPEYRGKGIFDSLFYYVENTLAQENVKLLGVDFESYNLTANGFWIKYFTAYTYSVARRIDEQFIITRK